MVESAVTEYVSSTGSSGSSTAGAIGWGSEPIDSFGGEGTGARALVDYEWESDHWYTMHIRCMTSETTGNTVVEQWVCDLETGEWTLLTAYDIGFKNSSFKGSIAIFLENYLNN